ncbi:MAG: A/G-specific adenine glycosylase [Pseudomonadota bacterium]
MAIEIRRGGSIDHQLTSSLAQQFSPLLLAWYDGARRRLPWRAEPGETTDPYRVWLSEIMLQQTVVATVIPYFEAFTARWPTVEALAQADNADVMAAWAGLGYYSRARNLHACAQTIVADFGGKFPAQEGDLLKLPGIGPYTAAAIAAIAFGRAATVVDGNVERVISRLFEIETALPEAKPEIKSCAAKLTPAQRAGDYAQAMMDLGATICRPKSPQCLICPVRVMCGAHQSGTAERYPVKAPKKVKPKRNGHIFIVRSSRDRLLLIRRPKKGLLGGMRAFPSTEWHEGAVPPTPPAELSDSVAKPFQKREGQVRHVFTHFELMLDIWLAEGTDEFALEGPHEWWPTGEIHAAGLPTVMAKAARIFA